MIAELFYMETTIWAKTPYRPDFVSTLKEEIPKDYRYWDASERVWVVSYMYENILIVICQKYFEDVIQYKEKETRFVLPTQISSPEYQTLHLLPTAPREVVMAAYRALSRLYHPDVSKEPDANDKMKQINIAFDIIMGRR